MRYLVDDIDKDSIMAMAVGPKQMILNDMAPDPEAEHPVRSTAFPPSSLLMLSPHLHLLHLNRSALVSLHLLLFTRLLDILTFSLPDKVNRSKRAIHWSKR